MVLANSDDKAVHLVVDLHQGRAQGCAHGRRRVRSSADPGFKLPRRLEKGWLWFERFPPESVLEQLPDFIVVRVFRQNVVA
jgi:hypothetical protein